MWVSVASKATNSYAKAFRNFIKAHNIIRNAASLRVCVSAVDNWTQ